jgi:transcriptional regulator with XRE-family HTH domain
MTRRLTVRRRNGARKEDAAVAGIRGGQALKQAIHVARARAGITSDMELSRRADVSYDTFMNWYGDKTLPRGHEIKKVADALGVPYGDLMAAYEGRDLEPPPLQDAIRELIEEMRLTRAQQHEATDAILSALAAVLHPGRGPRGTSNGNEREAPADTQRSSS